MGEVAPFTLKVKSVLIIIYILSYIVFHILSLVVLVGLQPSYSHCHSMCGICF